MIIAVWTKFKQLRIEAWKSQDFNGVWTRDLAIPVRRSNQMSYEVTDVASLSLVSSNEPVKNGCEVIIWNVSYIELRILKSSNLWSSQCDDHSLLEKSDDHSLLDFKIRSSIYETFHISLHIHLSHVIVFHTVVICTLYFAVFKVLRFAAVWWAFVTKDCFIGCRFPGRLRNHV